MSKTIKFHNEYDWFTAYIVNAKKKNSDTHLHIEIFVLCEKINKKNVVC